MKEVASECIALHPALFLQTVGVTDSTSPVSLLYNTGMMHIMTPLHYTSLKITCFCNYCRGLNREGEGVGIHGKLQRINTQSILQSFSCSWQE